MRGLPRRVGVDFEMDRADLEAGRDRLPVLVLWGERSHVERHFAPVEAWQAHASNLVGERLAALWALPGEQCPDETLDELVRFFRN